MSTMNRWSRFERKPQKILLDVIESLIKTTATGFDQALQETAAI